MNDTNMQCDPVTGTCEVPGVLEKKPTTGLKKPVKMLYFTDPICSSCWGIEPQLRKLKLEYGDYFDIEYRMGGLLKSWNEYGGSDVSGPASVAAHWDEASAYYEMPIDGDVWKEDPLHSSYPPSVAFKAAQLQGEEKAALFLRRIKEMVFLEKKNITKWEWLSQAALETGLDIVRFKHDFENNATNLFTEDLQMARQWGVRGFPTIFFIDEDDNRFKVYGSKPYEVYEQALLKLAPQAIKKTSGLKDGVFPGDYATMTTKEFEMLSGKQPEETEAILNGLFNQQKVEKFTTRNGAIWKRK